MKLLDLKFQNAEYKLEDTQVTVRRGVGWYRRAEAGDYFSIGDAVGIVVGVYSCMFLDIPIDYVAKEHDPKCRSYTGLLDTMKKLYPRFTEKELVTCILFKAVDKNVAHRMGLSC